MGSSAILAVDFKSFAAFRFELLSAARRVAGSETAAHLFVDNLIGRIWW